MSQTVNLPKQKIGAREGSSVGRYRSQVGRPRQQGNVYAMTQQEAQKTPNVVTSMIAICSKHACVLIDPGTTHSFVSRTFAMHANRCLEPLLDDLLVHTDNL